MTDGTVPTVKQILTNAFELAGIRCGHHIIFSKWSPAGDDIGLVEFNTLSELKRSLTQGSGTYFLELENANVGLSGSSFYMAYVGVHLDYKDGKWEVTPYPAEEELPHDVDISTLDARLKMVAEKIKGVISVITSTILYS